MATILSVCAKCSDLFSGDIRIGDQVVKKFDGYVPSNLGIGGGDYVEFQVDLETGQILDWQIPDLDVVDDLEEYYEYKLSDETNEEDFQEYRERCWALDEREINTPSRYYHPVFNPKGVKNPTGSDLRDLEI